MDGWMYVWSYKKWDNVCGKEDFLKQRTTSWRGKFVTSAVCSHYWFICLPFSWSPVPWVEWRAFEGAHVRDEVLTIIQLPSWAERVWKVLLILNEFDEQVYIYDTKACWVSHLFLHPCSFSCRHDFPITRMTHPLLSVPTDKRLLYERI